MCKIHYQVPISVLTKNVTQKEELLNLNFEERSEVKSLAFSVSLC